MGRSENPVYRELRKEIRSLARFLQARTASSTFPFTVHKRLGYAQSVASQELSQMAGKLLSLLTEVSCECKRLPHLENCNRVRALEWEYEFFERWGLTRRSNTGNVPSKLKEEAAKHETSSIPIPGVVPFRRSG